MNLHQLQAQLASKRGPDYWRCLEDLVEAPAFEQLLSERLPQLHALWRQPLDRRAFLKLSAAALAMAGLAACTRQPPEEIVPYVRMPPQVPLGAPLHYATTLSSAGAGVGVIVATYEGRPLHIGGNPAHPASPQGGLDVFNQAALLELYDPDRGQGINAFGQPSNYAAFQAAWEAQRRRFQADQGHGLHILTPELHSPAIALELQALLRAFPAARWYGHEPLAPQAARAGAQLAFGRVLDSHYELRQAEVVVSLDADLLGGMAGSFRYAHDFIEGRGLRDSARRANRLYVIESQATITGAKADHRYGIRPSEVELVARHLSQRLGLDVSGGDTQPLPEPWLAAITAELQAHRGRSLVVPGAEQPAAVHALAHAINAQLGNVGRTLLLREPALPHPLHDLAELQQAIQAGAVDTLLILGGNPAYDAPAELDFAAALQQVPLRIYAGLYRNETAWLSHWYLPLAHELESWGDLLAFDGSASLVQPLVRPIYGGLEPLQLLPELRGDSTLPPRERLRQHWRQRHAQPDFEQRWASWLHEGVVPGSKPAPVSVDLRPNWQQDLPPPPQPTPLELRLAPSPCLQDGRFANNAWLQELPQPLSKLVWGNAVLIGPQLAEELRLASNDVVELQLQARRLEAPVFVLPGQPGRTVTLHLGYGRHQAGRVGNAVGVNAYQLRQGQQWFAPVRLQRLGRQEQLVTTQRHHAIHGDSIIHGFTLDAVRQGAQPPVPPPPTSLYPDVPYESYRWGMAIDLTACIGCNACVIACQMENNQPTVGKEEVHRGHEMHWLRIDRYYKGSPVEPEVVFQPVPCMHCEQAPCEYVCPVHATTHSSEGVNQMNYQRCIGTRDCSQNCPYKVRRFNWFDYNYHRPLTTAQSLAHNPEVTVRSRGVMEKCTYCIQRITKSRIRAQIENRRIQDGEVRTACQEACPTQAIVFGDLNDPEAQVNRLKDSPLNYRMLVELNTRPRTSYLAEVRNPNAVLAAQQPPPTP